MHERSELEKRITERLSTRIPNWRILQRTSAHGTVRNGTGRTRRNSFLSSRRPLPGTSFPPTRGTRRQQDSWDWALPGLLPTPVTVSAALQGRAPSQARCGCQETPTFGDATDRMDVLGLQRTKTNKNEQVPTTIAENQQRVCTTNKLEIPASNCPSDPV